MAHACVVNCKTLSSFAFVKEDNGLEDLSDGGR